MAHLLLEECCQKIMDNCPSKYAKAYAHLLPCVSGEALSVQILYVLSNLSHWRGEEASQVKESLRAIRARIVRTYK